MRRWLKHRRTKRKALQQYGNACAHCLIRQASTLLPRHHHSVGDDMQDADSWLPLCPRCQQLIEHERMQWTPGGYGVQR
jgi:hypothetical protein